VNEEAIEELENHEEENSKDFVILKTHTKINPEFSGEIIKLFP